MDPPLKHKLVSYGAKMKATQRWSSSATPSALLVILLPSLFGLMAMVKYRQDASAQAPYMQGCQQLQQFLNQGPFYCDPPSKCHTLLVLGRQWLSWTRRGAALLFEAPYISMASPEWSSYVWVSLWPMIYALGLISWHTFQAGPAPHLLHSLYYVATLSTNCMGIISLPNTIMSLRAGRGPSTVAGAVLGDWQTLTVLWAFKPLGHVILKAAFDSAHPESMFTRGWMLVELTMDLVNASLATVETLMIAKHFPSALAPGRSLLQVLSMLWLGYGTSMCVAVCLNLGFNLRLLRLAAWRAVRSIAGALLALCRGVWSMGKPASQQQAQQTPRQGARQQLQQQAEAAAAAAVPAAHAPSDIRREPGQDSDTWWLQDVQLLPDVQTRQIRIHLPHVDPSQLPADWLQRLATYIEAKHPGVHVLGGSCWKGSINIVLHLQYVSNASISTDCAIPEAAGAFDRSLKAVLSELEPDTLLQVLCLPAPHPSRAPESLHQQMNSTEDAATEALTKVAPSGSNMNGRACNQDKPVCCKVQVTGHAPWLYCFGSSHCDVEAYAIGKPMVKPSWSAVSLPSLLQPMHKGPRLVSVKPCMPASVKLQTQAPVQQLWVQVAALPEYMRHMRLVLRQEMTHGSVNVLAANKGPVPQLPAAVIILQECIISEAGRSDNTDTGGYTLATFQVPLSFNLLPPSPPGGAHTTVLRMELFHAADSSTPLHALCVPLMALPAPAKPAAHPVICALFSTLRLLNQSLSSVHCSNSVMGGETGGSVLAWWQPAAWMVPAAALRCYIWGGWGWVL